MRPTALITGAARRIGAAIARHMARNGYDVALHCHRSRADAEALAAELAADGARCAILSADLSQTERLPGLVDAAATLGPLSLLVNNASSFVVDEAATLTAASLRTNLAVNLEAPVLLALAFAEHVRRSGRVPGEASVVNIIDQRVWKLTPQFFSYTLAKSGLWTATRTLAQALAPEIRVNAVGPGPTFANITDGPDGMAREAAGVPLARAVRPEEIAEAVLYLARARAVTGQMIAVDAGQHLGWRTPDVLGTLTKSA